MMFEFIFPYYLEDSQGNEVEMKVFACYHSGCSGSKVYPYTPDEEAEIVIEYAEIDGKEIPQEKLDELKEELLETAWDYSERSPKIMMNL